MATIEATFAGEKDELLRLIDSSFAEIKPPEQISDLTRIEDFEREFGKDYFVQFWKVLYHLEPEYVAYILPLAMKYYVLNYHRLDDDYGTAAELNLLINQLSPSDQQMQETIDRYDENFRRFSANQRRAVCEWLLFIKKHDLRSAVSDVKSAIHYWCEQVA